MAERAVTEGHPARATVGLTRGERGVVGVGIVGLLGIAAAGVLLVRDGAATQWFMMVIPLVIAGVAVAGLMALSLTLSQRFNARLSQLREVAMELGMGDLSARAPVDPPDDLGQLGSGLNAMADRISRVLQAQKDLLAGVSHELRSPLARIAVALELIRIELEAARAAAPAGLDRRKPSEGEQLLNDIHEETALLERHISRLLEAQRVGVDRVLVQRAEVCVDELIDNVMHRERHRLEKQGFTVELDLKSDYAVVSGDENALDRVISTLVENSVQHAGDGDAADGHVIEKALRIESARDPLGGVYRIMDRGPGLTIEQCTRVFEAFFRTDASRNANTGGTGLGLYLVKRITEAHGGSARALPRPGGGLIVELRLPLLGQKEFTETVRMQALSPGVDSEP